ncbi:MAG: DUF3794 domain-containing protein [Tepidibacter sp.]|jgi:hypothetical protein|uniref:DUF3794 domain-containing protein n=1 Tax=Tepidibacter sp. TaxID=2529387 RepID=UPI0025FDCE9E|nr:DUF3794 domain-containing protein [Tepidibacter sp.]MCT4508395.1 DUF3794 domain-containing protein [Tepidibacter sp.]
MNCKCNNKVEKKIGTISCSSTGQLDENSVYSSCGCEEDMLIEIKGLCSAEKLENMDTGTTWTQVFIPEVLCIPEQKPDVEQVASIVARVEIISQRVVKTPIFKLEDGTILENNEGTKVTGRKLVIEGILRQKIIYTADVKEQSMHSAHFDVPFSAFIILEEDASLVDRYSIQPCIEDIFVCRVSKRQIFKNVTLFIKATKCS